MRCRLPAGAQDPALLGGQKRSLQYREISISLCFTIVLENSWKGNLTSLGLHSTNSYTSFSKQVGFCLLLIWRGSRVKFRPTLYSKGDTREKLQQPKEEQPHSRNSSCSLSTGNKMGTLSSKHQIFILFFRAWSNSFWLPRKLHKVTSKEASNFKIMGFWQAAAGKESLGESIQTSRFIVRPEGTPCHAMLYSLFQLSLT